MPEKESSRALYAGIDLGSTNSKCSLFDEKMKLVASVKTPVRYRRKAGGVEFDGEAYVRELLSLLSQARKAAGSGEIVAIAFTGQAESLVVLGADGMPLRPVLSWMDTRAEQEVATIEEAFSPQEVQQVTGQLAVTSSWPAAKILWLKKHEPDVYEAAAKYVLLKDYVVSVLTGRLQGDMSIATFTGYFDIYGREYWQKMLDFCGIRRDQLPNLCESLTIAGPMKRRYCDAVGLTHVPVISAGTLDHFAGMIGTGNLSPGQLTLSTGTVMALATMTSPSARKTPGIANHYGFLPRSHVLLSVAESGGVSLEWFKKACLGSMSYDELNARLKNHPKDDLLFLPYIVGANAPDFDSRARGVFYGLSVETTAEDMAHAVMEGVAMVARKNCEAMSQEGIVPESIVATGGGSRSQIWCQLQADITGLPVRVPREEDAAVLGAAIIAAVSAGRFPDLEAAVAAGVVMKAEYLPQDREYYERKYKKFEALYQATLEINSID